MPWEVESPFTGSLISTSRKVQERALPTGTKVECGTSQNKSETSVNVSNRGNPDRRRNSRPSRRSSSRASRLTFAELRGLTFAELWMLTLGESRGGLGFPLKVASLWFKSSLICLRHPEMTEGENVNFDIFQLGSLLIPAYQAR